MDLFLSVPGPHWPVILREDALSEPPFGTLVLRPLRRSDRGAWQRLRADNAQWLGPWEASSPFVAGQEAPAALTFAQYVRAQNRSAARGASIPFALEIDGELCGQLTISAITLGSVRGASVGYWVGQEYAGRGIAPTAVALAIDHCFLNLQLHRIEVNIRPENEPSLKVAHKLGLRDEGLRERYIHINGSWADHRAFAITADEVPLGLLRRWRSRN